MRTTKQQLGVWGEEYVRKYYIRAGFHLLAQNVRIGRSELDLLFEKDDVLYSVEVKTRRSLFFGNPEESITSKKRRRLYRTTAECAAISQKKYRSVIVQVCAVIVTNDRVSLKIYTLY